MEEGFGDVWCRARSRSREGKPLYVDANGPPVQALGPPTTCRQNTLRGALGSRLWRMRLVPPRRFARLSCLPTLVLSEVRNTWILREFHCFRSKLAEKPAFVSNIF